MLRRMTIPVNIKGAVVIIKGAASLAMTYDLRSQIILDFIDFLAFAITRYTLITLSSFRVLPMSLGKVNQALMRS